MRAEAATRAPPRHRRPRRPLPPRARASTDRKYLLERVDDAAVVQVYADGFRDLPLKEKTLVWHLYQAALAGRDIYYDQRYAHNLEMRDVLEAIVSHPDGVDRATLAEIQRYTKLFWINSGPYNNLTARKFVLTCTPEAFAAAAHAAEKSGAKFPLANGETLDQMLARLRPMFFDLECRSAGHGQDAAARKGHPHGERQQPVRRRDDEGCRRAARGASAQLASGEGERQDHRRGVPDRRPLQPADRRDRRSTSRRRSRLRPSRWPRR